MAARGARDDHRGTRMPTRPRGIPGVATAIAPEAAAEPHEHHASGMEGDAAGDDGGDGGDEDVAVF